MATGQEVYRPSQSIFKRIYRYRIAYAFIAPAVILMLLVHIIPTVQAFYLSLLDLDTFTLRLYLKAPFVGLEHYRHILGGLVFGGEDTLIKGLSQSLVNSFWFTIWVQGGTLVIGMVLALLLNRQFRGRGLARTLVLLPWVVPTFVVGIIWQFIWLEKGGLANRVIVNWLHLVDEPISWLLLENARTALIIPTLWRGIPFTTVMLLSALQVIPPEIYEAAAIDGANAWQRFRYITLPYLTPVIAITTMFGVIFNFFGFGPYNIAISLFSSDKLGRYVDIVTIAVIRQTFDNQLFGYGAAAAVLMMLVAIFSVGIWYWIFRSRLVAD